MLKTRAGFTLAEVLVALVLTAVIGAAVTGVFVTQSQFFDTQEKVGAARAGSRGALNVMLADMRMIEPGAGVESASNAHVTLLVPYAMGVVCGTGPVTLSVLPVDSMLYLVADSAFSGYAFRHIGGSYVYVDQANQKPNGKQGAAVCAGAARPVRIIANGGGNLNGFAIQFTGAAPNPLPALGTVAFLYERITYEFKASTTLPGRTALWRRMENKQCNPSPACKEDELVTPFAATAQFRFYVNDAATAQTAVPAQLNTITGLELVLDGMSQRPSSDGTYQTAPFTTSVFFKNRPTP